MIEFSNKNILIKYISYVKLPASREIIFSKKTRRLRWKDDLKSTDYRKL